MISKLAPSIGHSLNAKNKLALRPSRQKAVCRSSHFVPNAEATAFEVPVSNLNKVFRKCFGKSLVIFYKLLKLNRRVLRSLVRMTRRPPVRLSLDLNSLGI
jgi:hypothetical protein